MQYFLRLIEHGILALVSKLDRKAAGEQTHCAIIKSDNSHSTYPQTMESIVVVAVEDEDYYIDRTPGQIHPKDIK